MDKNFIVEICCGSAEDAIASFKGGATRVELNSDLFHGGLTPSVGSLVHVKEKCGDFPVMCMVRPREGGFCYTDTEFEVMQKDAELLIKHGADGIVFGFLTNHGEIDIDRTKKMLEIVGDRQSVFHRAIDVVPNMLETVDILAKLNVTRILTSGGKPTALEGCDMINQMVETASGRIDILPGAGIRLHNIEIVKKMINAKSFHLSTHRVLYDNSVSNNMAIHFGSAVYPREDCFKVSDQQDVRQFVEALNN